MNYSELTNDQLLQEKKFQENAYRLAKTRGDQDMAIKELCNIAHEEGRRKQVKVDQMFYNG